MRQIISRSEGCAGNSANENNPHEKIINPIPLKTPAFIFSDKIPAKGAHTIVAKGQGVNNKPVATSSRPSTRCKKNGKETIASI